jgi:hypothetical protein
VAGKKDSTPDKKKTVVKGQENKQILIWAPVIAVLLFLALFLWKGSCPRTPISPLSEQNGDSGNSAVSKSEATSLQVPATGMKVPEEPKIIGKQDIGPMIQSVRITPTQPLPSDRITAKAALADDDVEGVSFLYRWKVNERFVPGAGDTLDDVVLKRHDRISVVVSALRDGKEGPRTESQTVVVYGLPPSLEMKILTTRFRPGETAEIQLTGAAPDGDKLVYSIVSPFVDGMKIDENSGKILWKPERLLPGKLQFGAAAADTDGNRTTRVFEIDLGAGSSP